VFCSKHSQYMSHKDDILYLGQMYDAASWVTTRLSQTSRDDFDHDETLQLAVVHQIQVVGEAARLVSETTRQSVAEIPWKQIVGMRHRIVHDYTDIDLDIVWEVAKAHLPSLVESLKKVLPEEGE
jgi:uncharacterized protein with HEPN domain